jgi:hypothetical protein
LALREDRDRARHPTRRELDPVFRFEISNLALVKPDRDEILQGLVPQLVSADGRDDERGGFLLMAFKSILCLDETILLSILH